MNVRESYCMSCHEWTPTRIECSMEELKIRGIAFGAPTYYGRCGKCGGPVYNPVINDANVAIRQIEHHRKLWQLLCKLNFQKEVLKNEVVKD